MARTVHKLTDAECKAVTKPGLLSDGGGLYLNVKPSGSKSWSYVWKANGKRSEMGFGAYPAITLAKARKLAAQAREDIAEGKNPIAEKHRDEEPNFKECTEQFLASMEGQWRNEKHRAQWRMTLEEYAKPLHKKKPSEIDTHDVLKVLNPIWKRVPETASRLRGRIEMVLDFAKAKGWRTGENVAAWRGHLKNVLPARQKLTRGHHAAMEYENVRAFVLELQASDGMAAKALEFLIHTAARSGEVLGATWAEIDTENAVWTIPASRMKAGKEHRVPLTSRALELIHSLYEVRQSEFVFPGAKQGKPLSNMAMEMVMRRMQRGDLTVHGFRSAFRDWAGDATSFPREVAEQALAHRVGDATEQAYRRNDALDKRRKLMEAWAAHIGVAPGGNVVRLNHAQNDG